MAEVVSKLVDGQVVRESSHEDLSVLRIIHIDCLLDLVNLILQFLMLFAGWRWQELTCIWVGFQILFVVELITDVLLLLSDGVHFLLILKILRI